METYKFRFTILLIFDFEFDIYNFISVAKIAVFAADCMSPIRKSCFNICTLQSATLPLVSYDTLACGEIFVNLKY